MPITVLATEGIFTTQAEQQVFAELSAAFLTLHNLAGNAFLTPNVIGEVGTIPKGKSFSGGVPADIVIVELKVPSFALDSVEQKQAWVAQATEIVLRGAAGAVRPEHVFANMVYAVDGLWGIAGKAYTNADLLNAVQQASKG